MAEYGCPGRTRLIEDPACRIPASTDSQLVPGDAPWLPQRRLSACARSMVMQSRHRCSASIRPVPCASAAAIEFVHSYSLVHDDLPAMDNADLRRGKPTVHKVFDDATAILAGDGLLTYAFEVLSEPETHEDANIRVQLVKALAMASGPAGMVGGQMLDLLAEEDARSRMLLRSRVCSASRPVRIDRLFVRGGGHSGARLAATARPPCATTRTILGLAFQIVDDLLDIESTEAETGKPVGPRQRCRQGDLRLDPGCRSCARAGGYTVAAGGGASGYFRGAGVAPSKPWLNL